MSATLRAKLLEARKTFGNISKNKKGYNYSYADLDAIVEATDTALMNAGLFVYTTTELSIIADKLWLIVTACLSDSDGNEMKASVPLLYEGVAKAKVPAQDAGSVLTYGRRYAYCALLNLTADEDTDGVSSDEPVRTSAPIQSALKVNIPAAKVDTPAAKAPVQLKPKLDLIKGFMARHGKDPVLKQLNITDAVAILSWDDGKLSDAVNHLQTEFGPVP